MERHFGTIQRHDNEENNWTKMIRLYNVQAVEKKMIKCCFTKSLARCNKVLITAHKNQHENDKKKFYIKRKEGFKNTECIFSFLTLEI